MFWNLLQGSIIGSVTFLVSFVKLCISSNLFLSMLLSLSCRCFPVFCSETISLFGPFVSFYRSRLSLVKRTLRLKCLGLFHSFVRQFSEIWFSQTAKDVRTWLFNI